MYYVYILKSIKFSNQIYIGFTRNIDKRISHHNSGSSPHTSKYKPWSIVTYHVFVDRIKAIAFERYLKSCSGRALIAKRFL